MDVIQSSKSKIKLYNTLSRKTEIFNPIKKGLVTMYNCGPTVYNHAHIGNLRAYIFADVLRRMFEVNGYEVNQVINITDVGHLVSDGDDGDDKMIVGATREGKRIEEIIKQYSETFYNDLAALNIKAGKDREKEEKFPRATHHIAEQIALIEALEKKGFTYLTSDGIYFNTKMFPRYVDFARLDIAGMQAGARVDIGEKKNITDFALWKFSPEDGNKREQEWDSPLGITKKGFPGWHIECSAMAMKYLGETIDIHTGGIDHIPVHHTNEIAQSESVTGKPFANYWMHSAFMTVDGHKMSKSLFNTHLLSDLTNHGISPLAFRYWILTAKYNTHLNFTWKALQGAQTAYNRLRKRIYDLKSIVPKISPSLALLGEETSKNIINESFNNDLDTASAIVNLNEAIENESYLPKDRLVIVKNLDLVFGLDLLAYHPENVVIPPEIQDLVVSRENARKAGNWSMSDQIRDKIKSLGYAVSDTPHGPIISKIEP